MKQKERRVKRAWAGVTLLEMVVCLAVGLVLVALAGPSLSAQHKDWLITAATNDWMASVHQAKLNAVTAGRSVVLCPTGGEDACAIGRPWSEGYLAFIDVNRNGALDPDDTILRELGALSPKVRVTGNAPVSRYIKFDSDGTPRLLSGAFQAGTLTLCVIGETDPRYFRKLVMSAPGRLRVEHLVGDQPTC